MTATRANHGTHTTREDSASVLTAIRGKVRRLPEGVEKQQLELMAAMIENKVPLPYLARQAEVMAG